MCVSFGAQIGEINVAVLQGGNRDNFKPRHDCARRVCAVGGLRNKTDIAMTLIAPGVISANGEQAGVFTLRTRIGL